MSAQAKTAESPSPSQLDWEYLGRVSLPKMRSIQASAVRQIISGSACEKVFICEHPPTVSLGIRTSNSHLLPDLSQLCEKQGLELVEVDRGGSVTYHGPGQLMLYPVISLRGRGLSVSSYTELGLNSLMLLARQLGVEARVSLSPAGLWSIDAAAKIGFVGLRIRRGLSDHGFAINVNNDCRPFRLFQPCGLDTKISSLMELGARVIPKPEDIARRVFESFQHLLDDGDYRC